MQSASALASSDLLTLATPLTPPTPFETSSLDPEIERLSALKPLEAGDILQKMNPALRKQIFRRRFELEIVHTQRSIERLRGGLDTANTKPWDVSEGCELQNNSSVSLERLEKYLPKLQSARNRLESDHYRNCHLCNRPIEWARMWVDLIATSHVQCKVQHSNGSR